MSGSSTPQGEVCRGDAGEMQGREKGRRKMKGEGRRGEKREGGKEKEEKGDVITNAKKPFRVVYKINFSYLSSSLYLPRRRGR